MTKSILIANPGSTSLKFKIYNFPQEIIIASGKIEKIGSDLSPFTVNIAGEKISGAEKISNYKDGINKILGLLSRGIKPSSTCISNIDAIGFKAVHAGGLGKGPGAVFLDESVLAEMERLLVLAPAHNKAYLDVIKSFQDITRGGIPLAALFEPAFHTSITEEKITYGIPLEWKQKYGIQRYGFHGASHRYISEKAPEIMGWDSVMRGGGRIISCHLGGSSSLCAIKDGKSVDTTMGFSPQSGILHSTRCETIDPFVVLFAQKSLGYSVDDLISIFCKGSGLAGISGTSGDMRDLWSASEAGSREALLALEVFYYQVKREIAAMAASLQGVDAIIFTGGIGENGYRERERICAKLGWLNLEIDTDVNSKAIGVCKKISTPESGVEVWVLPTDEELIVGREIFHLLSNKPS